MFWDGEVWLYIQILIFQVETAITHVKCCKQMPDAVTADFVVVIKAKHRPHKNLNILYRKKNLTASSSYCAIKQTLQDLSCLYFHFIK